jgi:hypothetical protein
VPDDEKYNYHICLDCLRPLILKDPGDWKEAPGRAAVRARRGHATGPEADALLNIAAEFTELAEELHWW